MPTKFRKLGLSEEMLTALRKKGFEEPTPIQEQTIPLLLNGEKDIVGQAQTGTGKTAAFGIPILEKIKQDGTVKALVLTPTRELAVQVCEEMQSLRGNSRIQFVPIYGGQSISFQIKKLKRGVEVVVGTPGRIQDLINRKVLKLDNLDYVVLDEADEMLNMGFVEDIEKILGYTPKDKKTLLFSATMPKEIMNIAKKYMREYDVIRTKNKQLTTELTDQIYYEVARNDKFEALCRIIDIEKDFYGLVFCRTKLDVDSVSSKLMERGYDAEALHGDISQNQRERVLKKFKKNRLNVLVATDVAARGIDINELTHVINYALPQDPESYVHRIGRTGRAGKKGTAINFVTPDEYRKLLFIQRVAKTDIRKEKIPNATDVIKMKKENILNDIKNISEMKNYDEYKDLAGKLLTDDEPENIIAALLKYSFQDELNENTYVDLEDVKINKTGKARLFIAKGRIDGMNPKKLVQFIEKDTKVPGKRIREVKIFDKFSFITVPFEDAEIILEIFKKKTKGKRSIVSKAKQKK